MEVTKEVLNTIHWKALTVFPKENLVVIECANNQQSLDFIKLLLANDFTLKIGEADNGLPAYVITFTDSGFTKHIIAIDDVLFKYFENKQVHWLTTGFDISGIVACLDDRIDIRGMNYYELN
jgi:hypothetical protein